MISNFNLLNLISKLIGIDSDDEIKFLILSFIFSLLFKLFLSSSSLL